MLSASPTWRRSASASPAGRLSARDLLTLLAVALLGGGQALTDEEVAALPLDGGIETLAGALGDCLAAAFGSVPANLREPQAP